jgi:hypothetical protein
VHNAACHLLSPWDELFDAALENAPLKQHPALAAEALDADIGAQPYHPPPVAAAGVLFLEADDIIQLDFHYHL